MKIKFMLIVIIVLVTFTLICTAAPEAKLSDYPIKAVPFEKVKLTDGFWAKWNDTMREVTIPHCFSQCDWRIAKFAIAAGMQEGKYSGLWFDDSDVYKTIEGASNSLKTHPNAALEKVVDDIIVKIAAAQKPNGYLFTPRSLAENTSHIEYFGKEPFSNLFSSHETYCSGHLIEAGIAYFQATGKRTLLDVAIKNADLLCDTFGPGKSCAPDGHPEIELALVKLYRLTGNEKYFNLAAFLLEQRGRVNPCRGALYGPNMQDHKPVVDQNEAVGHAVRAMYLYCGMSDVAVMQGRKDYMNTLDQLWHDVVGKKMYITGGIGAKQEGESFDEAYVLPNETAYTETCAAIGMVFWNQRLFLREGNAKYVDILERSLYNCAISGISLSGNKFFYNNVLVAKKTEGKDLPKRETWLGCPCCPPNLVRLITSISGYIYAQRDNDIYVNLFTPNETELMVNKNSVILKQQTNYPWEGKVTLSVEPKKSAKFALLIRIPGWARQECVPSDLYKFVREANSMNASWQLTVNGEPQKVELTDGYARINRKWKSGDKVVLDLPMSPRQITANPAIQADRFKVALQRGPLVYCLEYPDNLLPVNAIGLPDTANFTVETKPDLLGGIVVLKGTVLANNQPDPNGPTYVVPKNCVAIPYYTWANREPSEMAVWLAQRTSPPQTTPLPGKTGSKNDYDGMGFDAGYLKSNSDKK